MLIARDKIFQNDIFHAPDLIPLGQTAYRVLNAVTDHVNHADPIRRSANFIESRFSKSVEGHPMVDKAYSLLLATA